MEKDSIKVIIFDLGNVILPFNHYQIAERLSRFSENEKFRDPEMIFNYLFDFENGAINGYEVGKISSIRFFQSLKESLSLSISFKEFVPIWNDIFWEDEKVSEIIYSLRGKKSLCLFSNTNPLHFEYILSRFSVIGVFDKWILSHIVGFKKPAIEIYQRAIEWASIEPERIIFIDDMKKHVEVAISLGMKGIHYISAEKLKKELFSKLLDR